jgi:hypothetical protein
MERAMKALIDQLKTRLGLTGIASAALLAAALAFANLVVSPLEEKSLQLAERAARQAPAAAQGSAGPATKIAAVYDFLDKEESATDWLAKLHGIGVATGLQLKSASYRTQPVDGRIVRTEIVLPVAGSYGQVRDFMKRALAEIPVLSVDQLTLKKDDGGAGKNSGALQAELRLTLHMVKS